MILPFDAWLTFIAAHLREKGRTCHLWYDDQRAGNLLALTAPGDAGLVEMDVHRSETGAVLILLSESPTALAVFGDALGDLHHRVRRLDNAKRKFIHRIERMVEHLQSTFEERSKSFPTAVFGWLRGLFPEATPMVGIEGLFREKHHEPESVALTAETLDSLRAKEAKRYPTRFAARIPTPSGGRAALYDPERQGFTLQGEAHELLGPALAEKGNRTPSEFAILSEPRPPRPARRRRRRSDEPAAASAAFCGDCGGPAYCGSPDCGGPDLPDCDGVDVPDCSGCDISW